MSEKQIHLISKALADPRRFEILKQLGASRCATSCTNIRETQPITAATLSHHIKELETAGLISVHRDGKFANLCLEPEVLRAYLEALSTIIPSPR